MPLQPFGNAGMDPMDLLKLGLQNRSQQMQMLQFVQQRQQHEDDLAMKERQLGLTERTAQQAEDLTRRKNEAAAKYAEAAIPEPQRPQFPAQQIEGMKNYVEQEFGFGEGESSYGRVNRLLQDFDQRAAQYPRDVAKREAAIDLFKTGTVTPESSAGQSILGLNIKEQSNDLKEKFTFIKETFPGMTNDEILDLLMPRSAKGVGADAYQRLLELSQDPERANSLVPGVVDPITGKTMTNIQLLSRMVIPTTQGERRDASAFEAKPLLQAIREQLGPTAVYDRGWRMNKDGSIYENQFGAPQKLENPDRRFDAGTLVQGLSTIGTQRQQAFEIVNLINNNPIIQADLRKIESEKTPEELNELLNMTGNRLRAKLMGWGIAEDSPTVDLIVMLQRMASIEKRQFIGLAQTANELSGLVQWLPSASDGWNATRSKVNNMSKEIDRIFWNFIDTYSDQYDMHAFVNTYTKGNKIGKEQLPETYFNRMQYPTVDKPYKPWENQ